MSLFVRTAVVPAFRSLAGFRSYLRRDFRYRCAYCGITEVYRRGADAFGIDHFRPRRLFPALSFHYPNLYYCCNTCNSYKGGTWPDAGEVANGFGFADPCECDPYADHFREEPDGSLTAASPVGRYSIDTLRLNRRELVRFRLRCAGIERSLERCLALLGDPGLEIHDEDRRLLEAAVSELRLEWNAILAGVPWGDLG